MFTKNFKTLFLGIYVRWKAEVAANKENAKRSLMKIMEYKNM